MSGTVSNKNLNRDSVISFEFLPISKRAAYALVYKFVYIILFTFLKNLYIIHYVSNSGLLIIRFNDSSEIFPK